MHRKIVYSAILLLSLYSLLTFAFYNGVASRVLGANDFYSRWMGARALFLAGKDPYSNAVTREIQIGMYGRPALADEDQVAFAYPLYASFLAAPLVALPYAWAESFWIAFLIFAIVGASILFARWVEWPQTPWGPLALLAFVLTFYPAQRGVFLGQFALLVYASLAIGIVLVAWEHDGFAGCFFAIATVKPHVAILALLVILSWAVWHKRWRVWVGFVSAMAFLLIASFLLLPNWLTEFFTALGAYQSYIQIGSPLQVLSGLLLGLPWSNFVTIALSATLFCVLLYKFWRTIGDGWREFFPTIELAIIVTTFAMIRTATTDQTLLLLLWIRRIAWLHRAGDRWWTILISIGIVAAPWVVFLITLKGNQESPIATTTTVVITIIASLILSRGWRGVHPNEMHSTNSTS